jgi:hypothetical protein
MKNIEITYFFFECKKCSERWVSTFHYCPRCKTKEKFRILSEAEAQEQMIQNMIADKIHYVMLMEEG